MVDVGQSAEPTGLRDLARQTCLALYDGDRMAAVEVATRLAAAMSRADRISGNLAILRFLDQASAQLTVLQRLFPDPALKDALARLADHAPADDLETRERADGRRGANRRRG